MIVSKYNASGNDFVIFHTFTTKDRTELAKTLCQRQSGIGADGLIVLKPTDKNNEIVWEFYNSDGSVANMCGNGSRAAAKYAIDNELCDESFVLITASGRVSARQIEKSSINSSLIEVELTNPRILSSNKIEEFELSWHFYDTGVPHLVHFTDDLNKFDMQIARHLRHKYNANINYASIKNDTLFVRTYERGVENETLACGTGMAACFYGGVLNHNLNKEVVVYPKSGQKLGLRLENERIFFKGDVEHCFNADFKIM